MVAFRRFVFVVVIVSVALFFFQRSLAGSSRNNSMGSKQHIDEYNRVLDRHFVTTPPPPPSPTTPKPTNKTNTPFQQTVIDAFLHSWKGYKKYAWGSDELKPVSHQPHNWPVKSGKVGLGLTIVESLDTMWLMGLKKEFEESVKWVEENLDFDRDMSVSLFETTIRLLGGLCSAYDLTGRPVLLKKAIELADRLMPAFNTPTGIPDNYINLKNGDHNSAHWNGQQAILSEFGSIQLEFRRLSQQTKVTKYDVAVTRCMEAIRKQCRVGFCPRYYDARSGGSGGGVAALGGFGDSYYEYLLKQWLQLNKQSQMYSEMWNVAVEAIFATTVRSGKYTIAGSISGNGMEHLACFAGGLFALSYHHTKDASHLKLAEDVAFTCHEMYLSSNTGLAPDSATFGTNGITPGDHKYILRPETVETYFYLWRVTRDQKYRDWGFDMIKACDKALRVETGGYSGTHNVDALGVNQLNDQMESFWMAETLKYLYLLASDDSVLDINKWVFNTEAHPLRVME